MALKVPVVATDIDPVKEVLENNRSGELVPAEDPAALAAAISGLLSDQARAERFALAAQQDVRQRFSTDRMVREHEIFYREIARP